MKAIILAAGIGSRLRPVTGKIPKALIEIGGTPVLEIVIRRLMKAGVKEIIINLHYLPEMLVDFLKVKNNFGLRIEFSRESELLDTGGGLKKAADFFDDGQPFFLHNADVLSNIDLNQMYRFHVGQGALATLAVKKRRSNRYFLFDKEGLLCGWGTSEPLTSFDSAQDRLPSPSKGEGKEREAMAFCGIHVISPEIFQKMSETGVFSINQVYLRLAGQGETIQAFRADDYYWADIGDEKKLKQVRQDIGKKVDKFIS
ncbi:MAG: nucleotidyltransferase family protein [Elusimicrobia bacterium]|nr:nucleotidyltransferase family protein [Elusimicrobiota bacterium]